MKCSDKIDTLNDERIRQVTQKTRRWAMNNGFQADIEDMTQYVLLRLSQNRSTNVSNICIDYVRSAYGRTGSRAYKTQKVKSGEKRFYSELTEEICGLEIAYNMNVESLDFNAFQDQLESKERAILTLRFKWGMTGTEIADCFGISEERVSQKLTQIKEKLKDFIESDSI